MDILDLIRPDDWHTHFRDKALMRLAVPYTARTFARAIAMPNLSPPVTTEGQCLHYREQLQKAGGGSFDPLMTIFLTDETTAEIIVNAKPQTQHYQHVYGAKMYPCNATTHSEHGVAAPLKLMPVFEVMAEQNLPLLVHGETTDNNHDIYDREKFFIDEVLMPIRQQCPSLKIIFEHITTKEAVQLVLDTPNLGATITPHHLYYNRNALFAGGLHPHRYCLPLAKRESDRLALVEAACSGDPSFFAGTDSAPHLIEDKHSACGCAGIFNAPCALETYLEIFEEADALDKIEAFASLNGAAFYDVKPNSERIRVSKKPWKIPKIIGSGTHVIVPFRAGETINWRCL